MIDFADKKLDKENTELVQQHLTACKQCRQEMEELLEIFELMDKTPEEKPGEYLRANFMSKLQEEKESISKTGSKKPIGKFLFLSGNEGKSYLIGRIAAGIAILVTGVLFGLLINMSNSNSELSELKDQVGEMKQMMLLVQLQEDSPSHRIQAVNYIQEQITEPDPRFIDALIKTIGKDENPNVRMTAVSAMKTYGQEAYVREFLINTLEKESDPLMQITLINVLVELQETGAVDQFRKIMIDDRSMDVVKAQAKRGVDVLI